MTARSRRVGPRAIVLFGVVIALTAGAALSFRSPSNERPHLGEIISTAAAKTGDGGSLDLADVADFPWDRLYVIGPYASSDDIERSLGFDWKPTSPAVHAVLGNASMQSDELTLLVFVRGEREVTGWTILNRDEDPGEPFVNFDLEDGEPTVFASADAGFVVDNTTGSLVNPDYPGWLLRR